MSPLVVGGIDRVAPVKTPVFPCQLGHSNSLLRGALAIVANFRPLLLRDDEIDWQCSAPAPVIGAVECVRTRGEDADLVM